MFDEEPIDISVHAAQKGDYVVFRVYKWIAELKGLKSICGHKNDCVDQGVIIRTTPAALIFAHLEIHKRTNVVLPKSQFLWIKKFKTKKAVDGNNKLESI